MSVCHSSKKEGKREDLDNEELGSESGQSPINLSRFEIDLSKGMKHTNF